MSFERSYDWDGAVCLVRGDDIIRPKWKSLCGPAESYFIETIGHSPFKTDKGWRYFFCIYSEDFGGCNSEFGFKANETYCVRGNIMYPHSRLDKGKKRILLSVD